MVRITRGTNTFPYCDRDFGCRRCGWMEQEMMLEDCLSDSY